jgi:hypothetical protein
MPHIIVKPWPGTSDLAIQDTVGDRNVEWMEKVSDERYAR